MHENKPVPRTDTRITLPPCVVLASLVPRQHDGGCTLAIAGILIVKRLPYGRKTEPRLTIKYLWFSIRALNFSQITSSNSGDALDDGCALGHSPRFL